MMVSHVEADAAGSNGDVATGAQEAPHLASLPGSSQEDLLHSLSSVHDASYVIGAGQGADRRPARDLVSPTHSPPKAHMTAPANGSAPAHSGAHGYVTLDAGALGAGAVDGMYEDVQHITVDEELRFYIFGYRTVAWKRAAYIAACVLSLGVLYLVARWFERLRLVLTAVPCSLREAELAFVKNHWGETSIVALKRVPFHGRVVDVFPDQGWVWCGRGTCMRR
jgi:hypothetical protein